MIPDEGMGIIFAHFPRNNGVTPVTTLYLALFTSHSASTVITHAQTIDNLTEANFTNYARQAVVNTEWGAAAEQGGTVGQRITSAQESFPASGSAQTVNGAMIADQLSAAGDKCVAGFNFDDGQAVALQSGDTIKVTPYLQLNH